MITDDMVERGCVALVWAQFNDAGLHPDELKDATPENVWADVNPDDGGHDHDTIRTHIRSVLTAALGGPATAPAVGKATRMGWKRGKTDKFEVIIQFDNAPGWPIGVVWDQTPITLQLATSTLPSQHQTGGGS